MSPTTSSARSIQQAADLEAHYRAYISTLNDRDWSRLPSFLAPDVVHNDKQLGPDGYRKLIPDDTIFRIESMLADVDKREVASRLYITVARKPLREHVFYRWEDGERGWVIKQVWSIVEAIDE
jgi:hypothetical protein